MDNGATFSDDSPFPDQSGSVTFDGEDDEVNFGDLTFNGAEEFSMSMWIKAANTGMDRGFYEFVDSGGSDPWGIGYDSEGALGGGVEAMKVAITTTESEGDTNLTADQQETMENVQTTDWQHIAWTWEDGEGFKLWIDGQRDDPVVPMERTEGALAEMEYFRLGDGRKAHWQGSIGETAIWQGNVLTAEQVQMLSERSVVTDGEAWPTREVGPIEITEQPQDATVTEARDVSFSVSVSGAKPRRFEWFVGETKIEEATGVTLNLTEVPLEFDGREVSVAVSNEFSQATSEAALLSVNEDTAPPVVEEVQGFAGGANTIRIRFDEQLEQASATDLNNYEIDGLSLNEVSLSQDGRQVTLTTSVQTFGQEHTLSIDGIADELGNVLTTEASFTSELSYSRSTLADSPVRYWRLDETSGETAKSLTWDADDQATANGTYAGDPELGVEGLILTAPDNTAVNFDPGQNVDIPNGDDINVGGPYLQKTIEMWIKPDEILASGQAQGLWEQGGGTRGIGLYLIENEVFMNIWNNADDGDGAPWGSGTDGDDPVFVGGGNVQAGQPAHIVGVMEGVANDDLSGTLKLYVNGKLVDETEGVGQLFNHGGDVDLNEVGAFLHTDAADDNFNGTIDEVAHYNTALSPEQIQSHFEAAFKGGRNGPAEITQGLQDKTFRESTMAELKIEFGGIPPYLV